LISPLIQSMRRYATRLEEFEKGLYDSDENLIEEKLPSESNLLLTKRVLI